MADTTDQISIDLAVYMERLDTYIATQSQLNETLCSRLESLDSELEDLRDGNILLVLDNNKDTVNIDKK